MYKKIRRNIIVGLASVAALVVLYKVLGQHTPPPESQRGAASTSATGGFGEHGDSAEPTVQNSKATRSASQAPTDSDRREVQPLFAQVDRTTAARLDEWVQDYLSSVRATDFVPEYTIVRFDDVLLENLRSGAVERFQFTIDKQHSYLVTVDQSYFESPNLAGETITSGTNVFIGTIPALPSPSEVRLFTRSDGHVFGDLSVASVGLFVIKPIPQQPYHLIYKLVGTRYFE